MASEWSFGVVTGVCQQLREHQREVLLVVHDQDVLVHGRSFLGTST
jgi:hypothetical protein